MVLIVELRAVFAFSQEDFSTSRVHLCILGHVVDLALVDGPAVSVLIVLLYLLGGVGDRVWVLDQSLLCSCLLQELTLGASIAHGYFRPRHRCEPCGIRCVGFCPTCVPVAGLGQRVDIEGDDSMHLCHLSISLNVGNFNHLAFPIDVKFGHLLGGLTSASFC